MRSFKPFCSLILILATGPILWGCGERNTSGDAGDHPFYGQVPCLKIQCAPPGGSGSSGSGGSGNPTPPPLYGITATVVRGIETLGLYIPEENVQINENNLIRSITGFALPSSDLTITVSFSFLSQARLPKSFRLVVGPPQSDEEATFMYSEGVSDSAPQVVTQIISGNLALNSFSSSFVEGTFTAKIVLNNDEQRFLEAGMIRVRRSSGG